MRNAAKITRVTKYCRDQRTQMNTDNYLSQGLGSIRIIAIMMGHLFAMFNSISRADNRTSTWWVPTPSFPFLSTFTSVPRLQLPPERLSTYQNKSVVIPLIICWEMTAIWMVGTITVISVY